MSLPSGEPGRGVSLREGDVNLHTVACGGGFVWCGCSTSPSRLVRLSADLQQYETIVMEGTGGLHDLCWDGIHLWAAHSSGHLSQVDTSGDVVQTLKLRLSGDAVASLSKRVEGLLKDAGDRARANKRQTIKASDI